MPEDHTISSGVDESTARRREFLKLTLGAVAAGALPSIALAQEAKEKRTIHLDRSIRDPGLIKLQPEIRLAKLYTEITVAGKKHDFVALGARSCTPTSFSGFDKQRGTIGYELACDLTYFAADDTSLGPVRIVQDPRIETKGRILFRRGPKGEFGFPALNYFNQHLIFHVGDQFFYYPRVWRVVSSITQWPPEYHQYHHLDEDTPIFDFLTGAPNVARKGVSTISIEGRPSPEQEKRIRSEFAREIALINKLPASKMAPADLNVGEG